MSAKSILKRQRQAKRQINAIKGQGEYSPVEPWEIENHQQQAKEKAILRCALPPRALNCSYNLLGWTQ